MYNVVFVTYSSFVKDDITYRALPDLNDILSHPMPTRTMRSVTPPPIFTSGSHNGGKTYLKGTYVYSIMFIYMISNHLAFKIISYLMLFLGMVSSISTLTSNRYPYNSTMSELFEDLNRQRIQSIKENNQQFVLENSLENSR